MELRKKAGLTQRQVAEKLGITVGAVARWEQGIRIPLIYLDQVETLLNLYQCSISDLVAAYASRNKDTSDTSRDNLSTKL